MIRGGISTALNDLDGLIYDALLHGNQTTLASEPDDQVRALSYSYRLDRHRATQATLVCTPLAGRIIQFAFFALERGDDVLAFSDHGVTCELAEHLPPVGVIGLISKYVEHDPLRAPTLDMILINRGDCTDKSIEIEQQIGFRNAKSIAAELTNLFFAKEVQTGQR